MSKLIVALLFSLISLQASASAVFTLGSCNFAYGPYSGFASSGGFDQAVCSFAATNTSSINISNFGSAMIDPSAHGAYGVFIDLGDGSTWTNVFASPVYTIDTSLSTILGGTINFGALSATQLRLRSDSFHSWDFHNLPASMQFSVNDAASAVPEPASLAILGLGLAALGVTLRKKKTA